MVSIKIQFMDCWNTWSVIESWSSYYCIIFLSENQISQGGIYVASQSYNAWEARTKEQLTLKVLIFKCTPINAFASSTLQYMSGFQILAHGAHRPFSNFILISNQ